MTPVAVLRKIHTEFFSIHTISKGKKRGQMTAGVIWDCVGAGFTVLWAWEEMEGM